MTHKHNRRRVRPRHRRSTTELPPPSIDYLSNPFLPPPESPYLPSLGRSNSFRATPFSPVSKYYTKPVDLTGRQWQNGFTAWQKRERTLRQEAASLEAEQYRLFGGEPGDDEALCYKMLEYFGGLDYIDT